MSSQTLTLLFLLAAPSPEASPAPEGDPMVLLQGKTQEVKALLGQPVDTARRAKLVAIIDSLVDFTELARRTLKGKAHIKSKGKFEAVDHWGDKTEAQRTEFTTTVKEFLQRKYTEHLHERPNFEVQWGRKRLIKGGTIAKVYAEACSGSCAEAPVYTGLEQNRWEIIYKLLQRPKSPSGWVVVDFVVDGDPWSLKCLNAFHGEITKNGWSALVERIRSGDVSVGGAAAEK